MKIKFIFLFAVYVLTISAFGQEKSFKRYNLKSGVIRYEMTGMQTGTAVTYFDDYGMKEATYEHFVVDLYGEEQVFDNVSYLIGFWQYNLDKQNGIATKSKNRTLASLVEDSEDGNLVMIGKELFSSMGGKLSGEEEFMGRKCEIWELESMGTKIWVWENIPLKTETELMGISIRREAVEIEENADIPPSKFELPKDVEFIEIDQEDLDQIPGQEP
jgi:hypothetical protein